MMRRRPRLEIIAFFALLLVIDWFLYFRHGAHFFQGDSTFLLGHRAASTSDYLKEFVQLNPSGWYRPLANELVESILYPIAGLHPLPYRIPVYATFIAITAAVYKLTLTLTRRHLAAAIAVFFFTIHTTNAYTTYDVGFMPELLYAFFYLGATVAYLRYLRDSNRIAYAISLIFFIAALLSKEAAVTLPATLLVATIIWGSRSRPLLQHCMQGVRSTAPHLLILIMYFAFVLGHLHVVGLTVSQLLDRSRVPNPGDYLPAFNTQMFKTADMAFTWAFNIPRGWSAQWSSLDQSAVTYLKVFRALVLLLAAVVLFRSERRLILFGSIWFWITLLPALPLVAHFLPYYLFLPVVGVSLIVGTVFAWLYDALSRIQPFIAAATVVLIFGGVLYVTSRSIRDDIRHNTLLGGSAELASNTLSDLKRFCPAIPAGATLYFADANENLQWVHDSGRLIRMAYGMDEISVLYQSRGDVLLPDTKNAFAFSIHQGRLIDETATYRVDPSRFMK